MDKGAWSAAALDFYWAHPPLQRAYSHTTSGRARRRERRGDLDAALTAYCDAARRLYPGPATWNLQSAAVARLTAFLKRVNGGRLPNTPADNALVQALLASPRAEAMRRRMLTWTREERCRLRDNLIILKAPRPGERGVILLSYSYLYEYALVAFRLQPLFERFTLVLEPSWTPAPENFWALYAATHCPALVFTITAHFQRLMASSGLPLVPLLMGAHDWVDPGTFRPLGLPKEFDVAMVASFHPLKRHYVLFEAMRRLRPRRLRVALVGYAWGRTQAQLEAEMDRYGVRGDCTVFSGLDAAGVNEVLNRSRCAVMLSRREGANRSQMEALAAGVPLVLFRDFIGPTAHVTTETGQLASDSELAGALLEVIDHPERFQPRRWLEKNSGIFVSTARLNQALRDQAATRGEPWTHDIFVKCNRPELTYADPAARSALAPAWDELDSMLYL